MSENLPAIFPQERALAAFRASNTKATERLLIEMVGQERAKVAACRIGIAINAAVRAAKNPNDILQCSPGSVVSCIASAVSLDLYPRTANSPVWLIPKQGSLQLWVSHVGYATLAQRAGISLRAVPVHNDDHYRVQFGDIAEHDVNAEPVRFDDLAGVYVVIKRIADGAVIGMPWVSAAIIKKRKENKGAGPVWQSWPIEMAQKTAIKYLVARGILVIDLPEMSIAMDADTASETDGGDITSDIIEDRAPAPIVGAAELLNVDTSDGPPPFEDAEMIEPDAESLAPAPPEADPEPQAKPAPTPAPKPATRQIRRGAP